MQWNASVRVMQNCVYLSPRFRTTSAGSCMAGNAVCCCATAAAVVVAVVGAFDGGGPDGGTVAVAVAAAGGAPAAPLLPVGMLVGVCPVIYDVIDTDTVFCSLPLPVMRCDAH